MKLTLEKQPKFVGKVEFPVTCEIGKGLENAIACNTTIGYIDGENGRLYYRGIPIEELARHSHFEETAYLLLYGKLPTRNELDEFSDKLKRYRDVPEEIIETLQRFPKELHPHPMHMLMTGVSMLAGFDDRTEVMTQESEEEIGLKVISKIATLVAAIERIISGKEIIKPDKSLPHTANFLYMLTGKRPEEKYVEKAMDVSMILYADHGMNASTFTAMVIHSTECDMYASIAGAVAALKGSLHGGANERAVKTLMEIGSVDNVEAWYRKQRELKKKIPGFGHRVYKAYDPRAKIFKKYAMRFCQEEKLANLCKIAFKLEELVISDLGAKKRIFPNVDFYAGLVWRGIGLSIPIYTPIFAAARSVGWVARILEYYKENRIFRPRAQYYGPLNVPYVPIDER